MLFQIDFMKRNYATKLLKLLLGLVLLQFTENACAQAPVISYTGPQTYTVNSAIATLTPSYSGSASSPNGQTVTFAGSGTAGSADGNGVLASFSNPMGMAVDAAGNVYVTDRTNNLIRKITPSGTVSTLAGSGTSGYVDGQGTAAKFNSPTSIAVDAAGNFYVADEGNQRIRKITPGGYVSTYAGNGTQGYTDGAAASAKFNNPYGVAVDPSGNVFVADLGNYAVRKITPSGVVSTFATGFNTVLAVATNSGGYVYAADAGYNIINEIAPDGTETVRAGSYTTGSTDGQGTSAAFNHPAGLTVDGSGNIYVGDQVNNKIRKIDYLRNVSTLSGTGSAGSANGIGSSASFHYPIGVAADGQGNIYVADYANNLIRKIINTNFSISPALPAGLNFNTGNGAITGVPTASSPATNYTVTAYNNLGSGTTTLTITVAGGLDDPTLLSRNSVREDYIKKGGVTTQAAINSTNAQTQISYMDGLGRPVQRTVMQGSPLQKDIVQFMAYDQYGGQPKQYLPYTAATNDGSLQPSPLTAQQTFYQTSGQQIATDNFPFAAAVYDNSPLYRVLESGAPGADWQPGNHTLKNTFRLNTAADNIRVWNSSGPTSTYYTETQLSVSDVTDENGSHVLTFTNKLGQTVSKKVQAGANNYLESIVIYDDLGNVLYQVSPEGVKRIYGASPPAFNTAFIGAWATSYTYDAKGRLAAKKAPGAEAVYYVYDSNNRLVLTQDGRLRHAYGAADKWYATKYDAANRVVISGLYTYSPPVPAVGATNQLILQNYLDGLVYNNTSMFAYETRAAGTTYGYTNSQAFPAIADADVLAVNYYDDYDFDNNGTPDYQYSDPGAGYAAINAADASGLLTGSYKRVIGSNSWIKQAVFYDQFGNAIQKKSNNLVNQSAQDVTSMAVDVYAGQVTQTKEVKSLSATAVVNKPVYDLMGRVTQIAMNINGGADKVVAIYEYNELGQLKDKKLGQTAGGGYLQTVDFRYNIRGWLTSINNSTLSPDGGATNSDGNDLWGETILYNQADATGLGNTPKYNGKISEIKWKANDLNSTSTNPVRQRSYVYAYDNADRLIAAQYAANSGTAWNAELAGYNEIIGGYDNNGNILSLIRNTWASGASAPTTFDQLGYNYLNSNASNQLLNVTDASNNAMGYKGTANTSNSSTFAQYTYDTNGNLLTDVNKGQAISYNDLNKVSSIVTAGNGSVVYTYDASGTRLRKTVQTASGTTTTDYMDGFVYTTTPSTAISLAYFSMAEGRVTSNTTATTFVYEYFIKDHIGNTRVSFQDNGSGVAKMTQENEYYAFGMTMQGIVVRTAQSTVPNKQLYNGGSELQGDFGDENYSTPLREYDPQIGRFNAIDMMVDKYARWSPYNFAFNDPVGLNDPSGADPENQIRMQQAAYDARAYAYTRLGINLQNAMNTEAAKGLETQMNEMKGRYEDNLRSQAQEAWVNAVMEGDRNYIDGYNAAVNQEHEDNEYIYSKSTTTYNATTGEVVSAHIEVISQDKYNKGIAANQARNAPQGLIQLVAISLAETRTGRNPLATAAVASSMINRMKKLKIDLSDPNWLYKISRGKIESAYNAVRDKREDYTSIMAVKDPNSLFDMSNPGIKGAIKAYEDWNKFDYSYGATFFIKTSDLYSKGSAYNPATSVITIKSLEGQTYYYDKF